MKKLLFLFALACSPVDGFPDDGLELGRATAGVAPQELTWWRYAGNNIALQPMMDCAVARLRAATCLPIDFSVEGPHFIRWETPENMPTLWGSTFNSWTASRHKIRTDVPPEWQCATLTHEMIHTLTRSNGHASSGVFRSPMQDDVIDEAALTLICAKQDCGCFSPE